MSTNRVGSPSLDTVWKFPAWDNLMSSVPPWVYRGFWYHDGDGDFLVFIWSYSVAECGCCESYSGHIYRFRHVLDAIKTLSAYRDDVERGRYDGAFIFYGRRRPSILVLGRIFPEPLPDGRW